MSIYNFLDFLYTNKYIKAHAINFLCSFLHLIAPKSPIVWHILAHSNSLLLIFKQQYQELTAAKHFLLLHPPHWVVAFTLSQPEALTQTEESLPEEGALYIFGYTKSTS